LLARCTIAGRRRARARHRLPPPAGSGATRQFDRKRASELAPRGRQLVLAGRDQVFFFTSNLGFPITDSNILLTEQDIDDIIAFLRLL
jgi:hypothetical protein